MKQLKYFDMGLQVLYGMFLQKLFQVLIKMAVIIIAVRGIMKVDRGIDKVCCGLSYPHYLQGLFGADAGAFFKISQERPCIDFMLSCQCFQRNCKVIFEKTIFQYFTYYIDGL